MSLKNEIGERLYQLQQKSGKSIENWSIEHGISLHKFYSYKYGRAEPDSSFYKKLAESGVDMVWLFTGMSSGVEKIAIAAEPQQVYNVSNEVLILQARLEECRETVLRLSGNANVIVSTKKIDKVNV